MRQAQEFAAMAMTGALLGAAYDALGLLRRGRWSAAASDALFGLCCAAGVIAAGLALQCEVFRLYVLLGAALGFAAYQLTLGKGIRLLCAGMRALSKKGRNPEENSG